MKSKKSIKQKEKLAMINKCSHKMDKEMIRILMKTINQMKSYQMEEVVEKGISQREEITFQREDRLGI